MSWFKIDDGFFDHPKIEALLAGPYAENAIALWVLAGAWCARQLTDGFVPASRITRFGVRFAQRSAQELVRVGLWLERSDGWLFSDWADYQPTRDAVLEDRARKAENQRKHRKKKKLSSALSSVTASDTDPPVTTRVSDDNVMSHHVPARPGPSRAALDQKTDPEREMRASADADAYPERATGAPRALESRSAHDPEPAATATAPTTDVGAGARPVAAAESRAGQSAASQSAEAQSAASESGASQSGAGQSVASQSGEYRRDVFISKLIAGVREAFESYEVAPPRQTHHLDWPGWGRIALWCEAQGRIVDMAPLDVARRIVNEFFRREAKKNRGFPLGYLAQNPAEYWVAS